MADDANKPMIHNRLQQVGWFVIGLILFFWIGYEDRTTTGPILVGGLMAIGLSFTVYDRLKGIGWTAFQRSGLASVLAGLFAGTLAMPLAALAMLVKVSLHSHVPPDFTGAQVLTVLQRTSIWALVGTLIGLALRLYKQLRP